MRRLICWLRGHSAFRLKAQAVRESTFTPGDDGRLKRHDVFHFVHPMVCTRCWRPCAASIKRAA